MRVFWNHVLRAALLFWLNLGPLANLRLGICLWFAPCWQLKSNQKLCGSRYAANLHLDQGISRPLYFETICFVARFHYQLKRWQLSQYTSHRIMLGISRNGPLRVGISSRDTAVQRWGPGKIGWTKDDVESRVYLRVQWVLWMVRVYHTFTCIRAST